MKKESAPLNNSFLRNIEIRLTEKLCRFVPPFIGTKSLTFMSLCSSLLVFLSYYLSTKLRFFLFIASFFIILQWIFDCLDGTIGRLRKEGFVRWGFYMDHLFDYFFMASIVFGFWFLFPLLRPQILFLFFLFSSFMISFFIFHGITRDREPNFAMSFWHFSPIEFRLLIILVNILLYFFENSIVSFLYKYLLLFNGFLSIMLVIVIYSSQKKLNNYDTLDG